MYQALMAVERRDFFETLKVVIYNKKKSFFVAFCDFFLEKKVRTEKITHRRLQAKTTVGERLPNFSLRRFNFSPRFIFNERVRDFFFLAFETMVERETCFHRKENASTRRNKSSNKYSRRNETSLRPSLRRRRSKTDA